jgi:ribonuclease E
MTKRMLIDSTHAEETRVVVLDGNRLEDYDVETSTKQQLKGNIYLAKIVRVEPSLQAAFVEFGGGRHGFLAFGEIHPDYYQIPVADRKRLLEMQEAEAREEEEEEEREAARHERGGAGRGGRNGAEARQAADDVPHDGDDEAPHDGDDEAPHDGDAAPSEDGMHEPHNFVPYTPEDTDHVETGEPADGEPAEGHPAAQPAAIAQDILVAPDAVAEAVPDLLPGPDHEAGHAADVTEGSDLAPEVTEPATDPDASAALAEARAELADPDTDSAEHAGEAEAHGVIVTVPPNAAPEHIGGELDTDDRPDRRQPSRFMRNYKIQEVMRRRQILLVQVVKEERGTKGAALTTYISLAGRFSVLMPNSPRGGGISRKITSAADRRRLKEITAELDLPRGMGLIVRTAGAARPKPEILRDCEYLLSQWDQIRDTTMKSMAPAQIYEEASLIKRAIRDVYSRDVEEILVDGEQGWRAARDFMRMLMPAHAKKVQLWRDPQPLFAKAQVESQLDAMLQPTVQLRSGGYLVINQTEALVAIDVNSGRSTRERGIEETALRTNLEAAEEAARQLRLRDLAGLIVIDFIDMESRRNNAAVEKKMKDALKNDRARIQVGSISHFGLLEMSRQRLRPSIAETNSVPCPHCGGTGHMRSTESAALSVLRAIEDEGGKRRSAEIVVHVHGSIALYILNHKRVRLAEIEQRFGLHVTFQADDTLIPPQNRIEKVRALLASEIPAIEQLAAPDMTGDVDDAVMEADDIESDVADAMADEGGETEPGVQAAKPGETAEETEQRQRKRRRRRRGGRREDGRDDSQSADAVAIGAELGGEGLSGERLDLVAGEMAPAGEDAAHEDAVAVEAAPATPGVVEAPADDATGLDGERKRRGRRGGRRRRREPGSAEAAAADGEEASGDAVPTPIAQEPAYTPYVPTYTGPTPANPFGGDSNAFAFFDAVEEIEEVAPAKPAPVAAAAPVAVPAPVEPPVMPEPVADQVAAQEAVVETPAVVEPGVMEPVVAETVAAPAGPPAGPTIGPAIVPIVVGAADAPVGEKKKGWWRR